MQCQQNEILDALKAMPPLPQVAHRVLGVLRNPEYAVDDVLAVVRTDPSLTGLILRLCNSALFGLHHKVHSVADTIAYLGTRNLVKLALVSCTANHFRQTRASPYTDPNTLWRHTFAVATACNWLARRCGYLEADTAFTAGILHNLGKIVLSKLVGPDDFAAPPAGTTHVEAEVAMFGIDHATAAGIVVDAWNLPTELRQAVRSHHDPACDGLLPAILGLADTLVLTAGIGNPFPSIPLAIHPGALQRLHLVSTDVEAATAHVEAEMELNAELLNLQGLVCR